jgi:hypothetical protein
MVVGESRRTDAKGGPEIPWIVQALLLALALGMTSGVTFSAGGWIVSGVLLLLTVTIAALHSALSPFVAISAIAAIVFAFNAGICLGLVPRVIASGRASAN